MSLPISESLIGCRH